MDEGLNQGCPLSSIYAAMVLNEVIHPLDKSLRARAAVRSLAGQHLDDGSGGISHLMAYMDDKSAAIPLEELWYFFQDMNDWQHH